MTKPLTIAQYRALKGREPRMKYGSVRQKRDGITFDSKREAARYEELKLMERAGAISGLRVHPVYPLQVAGIIIARLVPDFDYVEGVSSVVEDVKSEPTKTPVWRLKWRMAKALYPNADWRTVS